MGQTEQFVQTQPTIKRIRLSVVPGRSICLDSSDTKSQSDSFLQDDTSCSAYETEISIESSQEQNSQSDGIGSLKPKAGN